MAELKRPKETGRREQAVKADLCQSEFSPWSTQGCNGKKTLSPGDKGSMVDHMTEMHGTSHRKACKAVQCREANNRSKRMER
jgi:hypothetical protein